MADKSLFIDIPWTSQPQSTTKSSSIIAADLLWCASNPMINASRGTTGALQGNPTSAYSSIGTSMVMDGVGDGYEFAAPVIPTTPDVYTMAAIFVCPPSSSQFVTGTASVNDGGLHLAIFSNQVHAFISGMADLNINLTLTPGELYLVVLTKNVNIGINYIAHAVNLKTNVYTSNSNASYLAWQTSEGLLHVGGARNRPTLRFTGPIFWVYHSSKFVANKDWVMRIASNPWQIFKPDQRIIGVSA